MRRSVVLFGVLLCGACNRQPSPEPAEEAPVEAAPMSAASGGPDGAACVAPTDCASGVCEGQGCDDSQPGTCAPAWAVRQCVADHASYCGCDGATFDANVGCPGKRYRHEGPCTEADPK